MKKISLVLALAVMVTFIFAGTAFAGAAKATGGVEFAAPGNNLNFNVHSRITSGDGPAWGQVRLTVHNPAGVIFWYRAKVKHVHLKDTDTVLFAAEIIATDNASPSWPYDGDAILLQVKDVDSPGNKGPDLVWGDFQPDLVTAIALCKAGGDPPSGPFDVLSGNLVVH